MTAEVVKLHDLDDEEGEFHTFLDSMKEGSKKAIFVVLHKDGNMKIGCTARTPAEMMVMMHHIKKFNEELIDKATMEALFEDEEADDE